VEDFLHDYQGEISLSYEKYHRSTIDCEKIRPHVKELVDRCGTIEAAGAYALVGKTTIARILHGVNCTVQRATASKIILALDHRREEDRKSHRVHKRLLEARMAQARLEDTQERLIGY
jgi:hypothetical protein